ncbi:MAG: HD domain-containing protein [Erysipelotrichaceae bacterium]|jgi:(p)ppGpp synthase/HD superfamily hydrolase|nr:HD domain-containing protein [Erysipelotrichaceae bacterium]
MAMIYTDLTRRALKIAYQAHHGQTDKTGLPYIFHPLHLAEHIGEDEILIATALLHDVVEDTGMTFGDLEKQKIPPEVIEALKLLTHRKDLDYLDYVRLIRDSHNQTAIKVKLADLRHNSDVSRMPVLDDGAKSRLKQYQAALAILCEGEK